MSYVHQAKLFYGVFKKTLVVTDTDVDNEPGDYEGFEYLINDDEYVFGIELESTDDSTFIDNITSDIEYATKKFNKLLESYNGEIKVKEGFLPTLILVADYY